MEFPILFIRILMFLTVVTTCRVTFATEPEEVSGVELDSSTFAVLMQGTKQRFAYNDILLAYTALVARGISPQNILILTPTFSNDVKVDKSQSIAMDASGFSKVEHALNLIQAKMAQASLNTQKVLVYFAGHGYQDGTINFESNLDQLSFNFTYDSLSQLIDRIFNREMVITIIDACYSGTSRKYFNHDNRILITSSDSDRIGYWTGMETQWGFNSKFYSVFSFHFFSALKGFYPNGKMVQLDAKYNSQTSYREAFDYAASQPFLMEEGEKMFVTPLGKINLGKSKPSYPTFSAH